MTLRRVSLTSASAEFLTERETKTKAADGKRPALCPRMVYQDKLRLERFVKTTKEVFVCDLQAEHFDAFFSEQTGDLAPKTRNHFRSTLGVFIKWCIRKSYLCDSHTFRRSNWLFPDGKAKEPADAGEVAVYSATELALLLASTKGTQQALIAIGAMAGLRTEELLRLEWSDVWRRTGFIEVTALKAKTRSRRLVPIVPALAAWLEPFRGLKEGRLWNAAPREFHSQMSKLYASAKVTKRKNALRHSFISYRLAAVRNEHQVAAEAGTSTPMIHQHYRELVTPEEATSFFAVMPPTADSVVRLAS